MNNFFFDLLGVFASVYALMLPMVVIGREIGQRWSAQRRLWVRIPDARYQQLLETEQRLPETERRLSETEQRLAEIQTWLRIFHQLLRENENVQDESQRGTRR